MQIYNQRQLINEVNDLKILIMQLYLFVLGFFLEKKPMQQNLDKALIKSNIIMIKIVTNCIYIFIRMWGHIKNLNILADAKLLKNNFPVLLLYCI